MGMFGMAIQFSQGYYLFDKRNKLNDGLVYEFE
jgi:hypothetical protein